VILDTPTTDLDTYSPAFLAELRRRFLTGPDTRSLVNKDYSDRLPFDWPLSFGRYVPGPIALDKLSLTSIAQAFAEFERASAALLVAQPSVGKQIMAGVTIHPELRDAYLNPATAPFSVRRLDLIVTPNGYVPNESDEMPGGFGLSYLLDMVHGVNKERWTASLRFLTKRGPLLFLVSTDWSRPYLQEIFWLAETLAEQGLPVRMGTTGELDKLEVQGSGVKFDGERIATVFRLFPIFEARGPLVDLVLAADQGLVRMMPEFASWANKTWYAMFWRHLGHYQSTMRQANFDLLREVLPRTTLLERDERGRIQLPVTFEFKDGTRHTIETVLQLLRLLPPQMRSRLVIKAAGANTGSARCYTLAIGADHTAMSWSNVVGPMLEAPVDLAPPGLYPVGSQPAALILQEFARAGKVGLPMVDMLNGGQLAVMPDARLLARPWFVGGAPVSCPFIGVSDSRVLHGTTSANWTAGAIT
jgi:hypothetical protein